MSNRDLLMRDESGVAYLEFLVVVVPIWLFALCVFQLALIAQANLIVKRSADAAARSAAVVLPDDPNEYGGEPKMSIGRNQLTTDDLSNIVGVLSALLTDGPTEARAKGRARQVVGNAGRSRLNAIRLAAHVPLMPLAPTSVASGLRSTLTGALGGKRSLLSALYYQPFAAAITFPGEDGDFVRGPEITVRVSYAYPCTVPIARRILCDSFAELGGHSDWKQAFFTIAQRVVGGRFRRLHHEATLLIHDAPYSYRPRAS